MDQETFSGEVFSSENTEATPVTKKKRTYVRRKSPKTAVEQTETTAVTYPTTTVTTTPQIEEPPPPSIDPPKKESFLSSLFKSKHASAASTPSNTEAAHTESAAGPHSTKSSSSFSPEQTPLKIDSEKIHSLETQTKANFITNSERETKATTEFPRPHPPKNTSNNNYHSSQPQPYGIFKSKKNFRNAPESRYNNRGAPHFTGNRKNNSRYPASAGFRNANLTINSYSFEELEDLARSTDCSSQIQWDEICTQSLLQLKKSLAEQYPEADLSGDHRKILRNFLSFAQQNHLTIVAKGVVENGNHGAAWLTYPQHNYQVQETSIAIPKSLMQRFGLKKGQSLKLQSTWIDEEILMAIKVLKIMDQAPEDFQILTPFKELIPYYPLERILFECPQLQDKSWDNISLRIIDLLSPIGLGQRGLIVAPPRTGKTLLLQNMAYGILKNKPNAKLIILLIDERPEEVTDFKRRIPTEVISSTFDESPENHVSITEMVLEKARCMVETGQDVIILLDSITRLARAYNALAPNEGRTMSGGMESTALQGPKRFFGSARNIEGGGSLTILATALIETGSRMDEVIFEEFKGTGNMELHLDRSLAEKRIFPAINIDKSGTRKEELLYHPDELQKIYGLRRAMQGVTATERMELLLTRLKKTSTNIEFLMSVSR